MKLPSFTTRTGRRAGYTLITGRRPTNSPSPPDDDDEDAERGSRLGTFRAVYLVLICSIGSFLFAYDTGIVGGILTLHSFQRDFRYTQSDKTQVNSNCVSILQAGAFVGSFAIWPLTRRLGRRLGLIISSAVFCAGAILQVLNTHSLSVFYAGRVISGLGVGGATVLVPMFSAEMAPRQIRGQLGSCFQLFFATGVAVSYWVDYACQAGISSSSSTQWQVPVGLQLVPGALVGLGMLLVHESTRWLAQRGRNDEALESLVWVRGGVDTPSPAVRAEFAEILAGVQLEREASNDLTWRDLLLLPSNRHRIFIAVTIQLAAQLTGNTSLAYYAPQIFDTISGGAGTTTTNNNTTTTLFVTGFFGLVKILGVLIFQLFIVERVGRRTPFMTGAFAMGSFMLVIGIIGATTANPPPASSSISTLSFASTHTPTATITTKISPAGMAGIALVYLEALAFNMSWGPLPWLYTSEIFPSGIRELGIATGAASQWLFNFGMSQLTPRAIADLGWRVFLVFAVFNYAIVFYAFWFVRETAGRSLEEMEVVFGRVRLESETGRKPGGVEGLIVEEDVRETA